MAKRPIFNNMVNLFGGVHRRVHSKSPSPLLLPARDAVTPLSESEAVDLVKDVFASATERDIYTGDKLEIIVVNATGIRQEFLDLRKD